jgi:hypothetical protein
VRTGLVVIALEGFHRGWKRNRPVAEHLAAGEVNRGGIDNTSLSCWCVADDDLLLLALVHISARAWVKVLKSRTLGLEPGGTPEVAFDIDKVTFGMADVGTADNTEFDTALVGILEAVRI